MYELPELKGLDCAAMFEVLNQWFEDLNDDAIAPIELSMEIENLSLCDMSMVLAVDSYSDNSSIPEVLHF